MLCFSPSLLCRQEAAGLGKGVMLVDPVAASLRGTQRGECFILTAGPLKESFSFHSPLLFPCHDIFLTFPLIFSLHVISFCFLHLPLASLQSLRLSFFKLVFHLPSSSMPRLIFRLASFQVSPTYILPQMYFIYFSVLHSYVFVFAFTPRTGGLHPQRPQKEISPAGVFVGKSSGRCSEILLEGGR